MWQRASLFLRSRQSPSNRSFVVADPSPIRHQYGVLFASYSIDHVRRLLPFLCQQQTEVNSTYSVAGAHDVYSDLER